MIGENLCSGKTLKASSYRDALRKFDRECNIIYKMITLIFIAIFIAMLLMTYWASGIDNIFIRIILVPTGMIGMISSAILFFLSILNLIL